MKAKRIVFAGLLFSLLAFTPVAADAHWGFGGGAVLGFGLGLFTGFALTPGPVYVAPPVYYAPPPPVVYPYYGQQQQPNYWYYCQNPQGYYPYVKSCPGGWMTVLPNVTPPNR